MSAVHTQTKNIGSVNYEVHMLPVRQAMAIGADVMSAIAPGIGMLQDIGTESLCLVLEKLFEHLKTPMVIALMDVLSEYTFVGGVQLKPMFDQHFADKRQDVIPWFRFAVETNYQPFIGALGIDLSQGQQQIAQVIKSLNMSNANG